MGCGTSTSQSPENLKNYNRRPDIRVQVQSNAKKAEEAQPIVVFIFGGPGSRKGRIVDDLVTSYGFTFISSEEVIFEELHKDRSKTTDKGMRARLDEVCSSISLSWLLDRVCEEIGSRGSNGCYLIDILPSLKLMLKIKSLVNQSRDALAAFERKHVVSFALNLAIPADQVLTSKRGQDKADTGKLSKEGQSDEADSSRTQKRASLYEQQVKSYLDYFSSSERLVTVDVTCGVADVIWYRVHELLCNLNFTPQRTVNTVLIFSLGGGEVTLDNERFAVDKVKLSELVDNPYDPLEKLLFGLSQYVDNHCTDNESFLVMCEGTTLANDNLQKVDDKGRVVFMSCDLHPMETYLPGTPVNYRPQATSTQFKAISSLENEVCLFPSNTPEATCKLVAMTLAKQREVT